MSIVTGVYPHQFSADKVFFHSEKLQRVLRGQVTMPSVYEVSPVGYCTQKCIYCVSKKHQVQARLSEAQIEDVVAQIADVGGLAITFTGGGEPLLNPFLSKAIEQAAAKGLSTGLITNGAVPFPACLGDILVEYLSFCRVSLDTVDRGLYRKMRGVDALSLVLQNLNTLVQAKAQRRSKMLLGAQIVWVSQSYKDVEATVQYCANLGLDFVQIRPVDNVPYVPFRPPRYTEADKRFLMELQTRFTTPSFRVLLSADKWNEVFHGEVGKEYRGCPGANFTAAIGHDYRVYFCCTHIGDEAFCLGDLREASLEQILLGEKRRELIEQVEHSHCQNQCRNHILNKVITSLREMEEESVREMIAIKSSQPKPLHWEFL
ncbi:radical SAM protein [Candidatus Pacearchaeota archaeon]|nr:MAG: radical SAM protein [Candidatus Pacearchaeota archaeon]